MRAGGNSGYRLSVIELRIDGRRIDPSTVEGLPELLARGNYLRLYGGYCDRSGENLDIEELANGPKRDEAGHRVFQFRYSK